MISGSPLGRRNGFLRKSNAFGMYDARQKGVLWENFTRLLQQTPTWQMMSAGVELMIGGGRFGAKCWATA